MRAFLTLAVIVAAAAPAAAQDERALFERGLDASDRGDDVDAERAFRASLALNWSVSAAYNLAKVLGRNGSFEEALGLLRRVEADAPAELAGRARDRIREMEAQRLTAADEDRRAQESASLERARSAEARGDLRGARDAFTHALELTGNPEHRFELAQLEDRLGDRDAALRHYRMYRESGSPGARRDQANERIDELTASDDRALDVGLTLGVGLPVTAGAAVLAGVFWHLANEEYATRAGGCAPDCADEDLGALEEQLLLTNVFLVASVVVGASTALAVTLLLTSPGGGDERGAVAVRVSPLGVQLRARF